MASNRFGDGHCFDTGLALQAVIKAAQKFATRMRIIFPGIFAVENDCDDGVASLGQDGLGRFFNIANEVASRIVGRHTRVDESDQIGDGVVAEDQVHRRRAVLVTMNVVELLAKMRGQAASVVAPEKCAGAAPQHAFVRGHPLNAEAVGDGQHFLGDAAFRRPHALGANAENFLVQIEAAGELLARVLGMPEAALRQRQAGR